MSNSSYFQIQGLPQSWRPSGKCSVLHYSPAREGGRVKQHFSFIEKKGHTHLEKLAASGFARQIAQAGTTLDSL